MLCTVNTFVNRSHKNDTKQLMDEDNNMLDADTVENKPHSTNTVTHKHLHKRPNHCTCEHTQMSKKGLRSRIEFKMTDKWDPDFMGCNQSWLEINEVHRESMKSDTQKVKSDAKGIKSVPGASWCDEWNGRTEGGGADKWWGPISPDGRQTAKTKDGTRVGRECYSCGCCLFLTVVISLRLTRRLSAGWRPWPAAYT